MKFSDIVESVLSEAAQARKTSLGSVLGASAADYLEAVVKGAVKKIASSRFPFEAKLVGSVEKSADSPDSIRAGAKLKVEFDDGTEVMTEIYAEYRLQPYRLEDAGRVSLGVYAGYPVHSSKVTFVRSRAPMRKIADSLAELVGKVLQKYQPGEVSV